MSVVRCQWSVVSGTPRSFRWPRVIGPLGRLPRLALVRCSLISRRYTAYAPYPNVHTPQNPRESRRSGVDAVDHPKRRAAGNVLPQVAVTLRGCHPNHRNGQRTLAASKSRQFTLVYKRWKTIEKPATYCHNSRCSASLSGGEPRSAYRIGIARSGLTSAFSGDRKNVWHATPQNYHHESP